MEASTKVTVTENETIKLYCNISSGIPEETLEWVYRGNVIQSGGPGSTRLMLKSTHTNSGQYYCRANSSVLDTPLTKSIEIFVHCKYYFTKWSIQFTSQVDYFTDDLHVQCKRQNVLMPFVY